jgi:hypothetical protein
VEENLWFERKRKKKKWKRKGRVQEQRECERIESVG